jgi:glyoxylase-like metal-dependent hydrolase (beta-lactamase superfamily II)
MRTHHLNCGTMRAIEPDDTESGVLKPLPTVCHCLLLELDDGLVLVETGIGQVDIADPENSLGPDFLGRAAPALAENETALQQVTRLGYDPADVRHIVLTHLDLDHTGGLPDFPNASVHLHQAELDAALTNHGAHHEDRVRYRPSHWSHAPKWETYAETGGESWFGFDAIRGLKGLPADILLIPLAGHTKGHCGVAVRGDDGWLLHAGDAYYYHGSIDRQARSPHPLLEMLAGITEVERSLRLGNVARLRALVGDHGDEVTVVSAHDPWELAACQRLAADPV